MGGSYNAALTAAEGLRRAGADVRVELASQYYRGPLAAVGPADTAILVSTSGESIELVELAERLRAAGHRRTIALVQEEHSPLAKAAQHVIPLAIVDENPIDSFIATVAALVRLGAAVRGEALPSLDDDAVAIADAVTAGQRVAEAPVASLVDVLGRGHLQGVAHQAALLLREISRVPASAWEPNNFRHGPMESLQDDQLTVLLRSTDAQTRPVDLALARDLRAIPGRTLVVSAESDPADDVSVRPSRVLPGVSELAALLPLIYGWGGQADVEPGVFRYTRVTITADA
jgi:fructoselysine-6-P-deglycase FrlB-like protein